MAENIKTTEKNRQKKSEQQKIIVIGDIHGCYDEFIELLDAVKFNGKTEKLILLGDYIDRGENSYKVIKKVQELQEKYPDNVIALRGNHEQMLIDACNSNFKYSSEWQTWRYNGGYGTMKSFEEAGTEVLAELEWFENLPLYYEDDSRIYVHAGINLSIPMTEQRPCTLLWVRESFLWDSQKYYKQVIFGHTPSFSMTKDDKPYETVGGHIGIDTGCVYGGALTALIIEDDKISRFIQIENELEETEAETK
jgi:serine/threonine protein phosphatase 1